jgi:Uma2 family endonuclease
MASITRQMKGETMMNLTVTELSLGGRRPPLGEPVWEMALLYPDQGGWSEEDYLSLDIGRLVEFDNGSLEFLPVPTIFHQRIFKYLLFLFDQFVVQQKLGEVVPAPFPVRTIKGKYREPDLVFMRPGRKRNPLGQPYGADLLLEIVSDSPDDRKRDLEKKRKEYAQAKVPEYWIVDPELQQILVLVLEGNTYREHGAFGPGTIATSVVLPGFSVNVDAVFAAGQEP